MKKINICIIAFLFLFAVGGLSVPSASERSVYDMPVFVLSEGQPIHHELERWCKEHGWSFYWKPHKSWRVLKTTSIVEADVVAAVEHVVNTLRNENRPVRVEIYRGNNVIEVVPTKVDVRR